MGNAPTPRRSRTCAGGGGAAARLGETVAGDMVSKLHSHSRRHTGQFGAGSTRAWSPCRPPLGTSTVCWALGE